MSKNQPPSGRGHKKAKASRRRPNTSARARSLTPLRTGRWNLSLLFPSLAKASAELRSAPGAVEMTELLAAHRRKLDALSPTKLSSLLSAIDRAMDRLSRVAIYASLTAADHPFDARPAKLEAAAREKMNRLEEAISWVDEELAASPRLVQMAGDSAYHPYNHYLCDLQPEVGRGGLEPAAEAALSALLSVTGGAAASLAHNLAQLDMKPRAVLDSRGRRHQVNSSSIANLLSSADRLLRERAWKSYFNAYEGINYTLSSTLINHVQTRQCLSELSKENGVLLNELEDNNYKGSGEKVADVLLRAARAMKPLVSRALKVRTRGLGLKHLSSWDKRVAWGKADSQRISIKRAEKIILEAVAPLGAEVTDIVARAFKEQWIDYQPRKDKVGSGDCNWVYGKNPFIRMSYDGSVQSLLVLAHELGHAVHAMLISQHQPSVYQESPSLVQELPSSLFEVLVSDHLMRTHQKDRLGDRLVAEAITNLEGTFFRQVQFFEFERSLYRLAGAGAGELTIDTLDDSWERIEGYWNSSPSARPHPLDAYAWSDITYLWETFYVLQYPVSYAAAIHLARQLESGPDPEQTAQTIVQLMKAGGSLSGRRLLESVGVDLTKGLVYRSLKDRYLRLTKSAEAALTKPKKAQ